MDNYEKARSRMMVKHSFFASILVSTPCRPDKSIPTAATDMRTIKYNPDFFATLTVPVIMFVLAHEILHVAMKHGLRRGNRNPILWNIAADYSINWILKHSGFELWPNCLYDEKYARMSSEEIYDLLLKQAKNNTQKAIEQGGKGNDQGGLGGDVLEVPGDASEKAVAEAKINQAVATATAMAKMAGNMPKEMERFIEGIFAPKVNWQEELRQFMTVFSKTDESWSRRNKRYQSVYLPSKFGVSMGQPIVIADTSGSITNEGLSLIASEVNGILEDAKPTGIHLVWADTVVAGEDFLEPGAPVQLIAKGGGGTDMRVPLEHAEQFEPPVVILITDGYTPWPADEPPYPLLVLCTTTAEVPIGHCIRVEL